METVSQYLPHLLAAWSIQWIGILSPGPGVALIMSVATKRGRTAALTSVFGIAGGAATLAIATVVGLAALFAQTAEMMILVRWIGVCYLGYLAYKSVKTAILLPAQTFNAAQQEGAGRTAIGGFVMQVTNPKALFFWLAIAASGGIGNAPLLIIVLFVTGAFVNSFLGHGIYALLLSSTPFRAGYLRARRWIELSLGGFFALFAIRLATERS